MEIPAGKAPWSMCVRINIFARDEQYSMATKTSNRKDEMVIRYVDLNDSKKKRTKLTSPLENKAKVTTKYFCGFNTYSKSSSSIQNIFLSGSR